MSGLDLFYTINHLAMVQLAILVLGLLGALWLHATGHLSEKEIDIIFSPKAFLLHMALQLCAVSAALVYLAA